MEEEGKALSHSDILPDDEVQLTKREEQLLARVRSLIRRGRFIEFSQALAELSEEVSKRYSAKDNSLTRDDFVSLAGPEVTEVSAVAAFNALARVSRRLPELNVYCPKCGSSFRVGCSHVELERAPGKVPPVITRSSLVGFVANNAVKDLRGIADVKGGIIERVAAILRGQA